MFETTNQNVYTASQTSTFVGLAYAGQHVPCRFPLKPTLGDMRGERPTEGEKSKMEYQNATA
jgi:hypothetical protein